MHLVADRFAVAGVDLNGNGGCALDLASGCPVKLIVAAAGDVNAQRAWMLECDERRRFRQYATPTLVDYGLVGGSHRFEAWSHDAIELTDPGASTNAVPVITLVERPAVAALSEMFRADDDRRPRVAALWGPPGSGRSTIAQTLARAARMHGYVPVDARVITTHYGLIENRTLFVIDRDERRAGVTSLLRALLRAPRAHVCLLIGAEELRGVDGLALDRVSAEALIGSVRPAPSTPEALRRVRRAADQAHGLPGRFVRMLWPARPAERRRGAPGISRAAEQPAAYAAEGESAALISQSVDVAVAIPRVRPWAAPGELASLRRRAESAEALLASGRHAPGARLLRQAVSALARRDAWTDAAWGALTLSAALLNRGRPREALRLLDDGRAYLTRTGDAAALVDVAVLAGDAWIDLAKLDEAERVLSGAVTAARVAGDRAREAMAATSLARCLFWRGMYADAEGTLDARDATLTLRPSIRRLRMAARLAIALGESARAMTAVDEARARAGAAGDRQMLADVACTSAFVRLGVGDLDGVDREAAACLALARAARQPVRALSARLLQAEADRRRGRLNSVDVLMTLRRLAVAAPPLIKARWELLGSLLQAPEDRGVVVRHAAVSGLKALELFGGIWPRTVGHAPADPFADEVVAILHLCQNADEEATVLKDVCARVRQHVHAATVAFVVHADRRLDTVAADGPRMDTDIAGRAISARLTIAPHRVRDRLESAAAVQYGGAVIGALCARWTMGTSHDLSRASAVLSMAATAAAPVLSSMLARRAQAGPQAVSELLGVTPAMAELRRSLERAAAAPFAVLIEGESGSGKELVARAIHRCGPRRDRPFCTLNCAALPDDLIEAELFGHARGAFTGAVADRAGVFEEANGGTLFLDEAGELSPRAQAKLLRVIQEGELRRVGENVSRRIDVRIVAATNRDLRREVEAGRFRLDLLYRLDVIRIAVPALRDRKEDVAVLVDHFWTMRRGESPAAPRWRPRPGPRLPDTTGRAMCASSRTSSHRSQCAVRSGESCRRPRCPCSSSGRTEPSRGVSMPRAVPSRKASSAPRWCGRAGTGRARRRSSASRARG